MGGLAVDLLLSEAYCAEGVNNAKLPKGFCAHTMYEDISAPRGLFITPEGHVLVLERGTSSVVLMLDDDKDLVFDRKLTLATKVKLNHGLSVNNGYLYASAPSTVYRWPINLIDIAIAENRDVTTDAEAVVEVVIHDMNDQLCTECGAPDGHSTRTLVFDSQDRLYVSIGSATNVDNDSFRARVRRFDLTGLPAGGIDFELGEVFADGMRNIVGLTFDKFDELWGVENGCDRLNRTDLGGDIHNDNPGEELNRFLESGMLKNDKHYGYPYCFTEFKLPDGVGQGPGSQWAHPQFINITINGTGSFLDGQTVNDEFCQQMIPAELSMQAHSAPLGIEFFLDRSGFFNSPEDDPKCFGGFPESVRDDAFVTFHGSWNRSPGTGRKLARIAFNGNGTPTGEEAFDMFCGDDDVNYWASGNRPVDVKFDSCGRLIVTSDGVSSGAGQKIFMITYFGQKSAAKTDINFLCPTGPSSVIGDENGSRVDLTFLYGLFLVIGLILLMIFIAKKNNRDEGVRNAPRESEASVPVRDNTPLRNVQLAL